MKIFNTNKDNEEITPLSLAIFPLQFHGITDRCITWKPYAIFPTTTKTLKVFLKSFFFENEKVCKTSGNGEHVFLQ